LNRCSDSRENAVSLCIACLQLQIQILLGIRVEVSSPQIYVSPSVNWPRTIDQIFPG